jgi:ABC-2 type transport system permease protein
VSAIWTIATRELCSYYRTPIGWVITALYLALSGAWVAFTTIQPAEPASLRVFFAISQWLLLAVAPAISMRLFSDEFRSGTIEPLVTSPLSDWHIVLGKYAGAIGFLIALLAPTLLYVVLLEIVADPDPGPILAGYLGLFLVGLLYLAVGMLFSSLSENQIVAFLGTLFFFLIIWFASSRGTLLAPEPLADLLRELSIYARLSDFAKGVIDTEHVVFFLAVSFWFAVLTVVRLEFRRWR